MEAFFVVICPPVLQTGIDIMICSVFSLQRDTGMKDYIQGNINFLVVL